MHIARSVFALPLAAAGLTRLEGRQFDQAAATCTERSFSQPRWFLYDPRFVSYNATTGGTRGDIGFGAMHGATGVSFECFAEDVSLFPASDQEFWHDCNIKDTQFGFDFRSRKLALRGSWVCDNDPTITFTGNATIDIPISLGCLDDETAEGQERNCLLANTAILAGLSAPINIEPEIPWLPWLPYQWPDRCDERSDYPTWEINDLVYDHSSAEHSVSFNATNLVNGEKFGCEFAVNETLTRSSGHSEQWIKCPITQKTTFSAALLSKTEVMFNGDYGILGLKQSWVCSDDDQKPTSFSGLGYLVSKFDCSTPMEYGGGSVGDARQYTCTLPKTNVSGYPSYDIPAVMPHTSYTRSCTMNSINATSFTLRSFDLEDANGSEGKKASFRIYNSGSGDEYLLSKMKIVDDGAWHDCVAGADSVPWQLNACQYQLDAKAGTVGFQFAWYCDDRDPLHAVLFNATASGKLEKGALLGVHDLSWKSTKSPMAKGPPLPWV